MARNNLAVTGVDYSEREIKFARVFVPDAEFAVMDLTKEHPTKKFDYVLLVEVLEHFEPNTINKVLRNFSNCLKDNGKLLITFPSIRSRLVTKHYQHFTTESLRETIETHFQIEALYGHLRTGLRYGLYHGLSTFDSLFLGDYETIFHSLRHITVS
ncbi:class I SAM-dependent methyltransferase [Candidatus Omnitrophota bacterium]